MSERKNNLINIEPKPVPLHKGRLDTATAKEVTYADYLYDLVEPHFAYYPHDVFLSKRDNKIHIEVYDQESFDYVTQDIAKTFVEEQSDLIVSILQSDKK